LAETKNQKMKTDHTGRIFAAACLGMLLFGIAFLSLGTVSTFIQTKFSLTSAQAASLASSLPFGMLAGTLVFGPVADRFGYKYLLLVSTLLIIIALEQIAFAKGLFVLQVSFFLLGAGGGAINGATNALAADITSESKGARLSLLGVFFGIGALGMPLLLGILTKLWKYETIISFLGWAILIPAIYFLLIRFPEPKQKQGFPVRQGLALLREPLLILIGLVLFFESGLEGMVSNWTTTFLGNRNIPSDRALFALSAQVAALVAARFILAGLLKTKSPLQILYVCLAFIMGGSILLFFSTHYALALFAMVLLGFGFAAGFPVMLGITGEKYPQLSGTAFSMVIIMALIGNTLLNYLTGMISDTFGIQYFPLILVCCVLSMWILLRFSVSRMK
jgi:MFS transporter, FHS family, glucose/mannose:H+ symporter